jgi:putative solute:sodium symporter small subunit
LSKLELIFGLLAAAVAVALGLGLAPPGLAIQGLQNALSVSIGAVAALIIIHALYRMYRDRHRDDADTQTLRTVAVMFVTLGILAALLVAATAKSGAASINGWPVGYMAVAQGGLIAMALLFWIFKRKLAAIEKQASFNRNP